MINNNLLPVIGIFAVAFTIGLTLISILNIMREKRKKNRQSQSLEGQGVLSLCSLLLFASIAIAALLFIPFQYGLYKLVGFFIGCLVAAGFGIAIDRNRINARWQIAAQIVGGCILYSFGIRVTCIGGFVDLTGVVLTGTISLLFTVLWIIIITNALQLMNRIGGLCASTVIIASICVAFIAYNKQQYYVAQLMAAVCGSSMGLLPYNLFPPKIPIGYSGSQLFGFSLAAAALMGEIPLKGAAAMALFVPTVVLGITLVKVLYCFIKRRPQIKKDHYYRKLIWENFTYKQTLIVMCCINGIMGIVAILYSNRYMVECLGLCAIVLMLFYVLVTNTNSKNVNLKAVNAEKNERKRKSERGG